MSLIASLKEKLQAATLTLVDDITARRAAIAAKRAARDHAERAYRSPDEVIARFETWVDATAAYQRHEYGRNLVTAYFGAPPGTTDSPAPWTPSTPMTWGFACLFLGPHLKDRFADLVRSVEYEAGPAEGARPALIARLTRELAALEAEEEAVIDAAAESGVVIAHRPDVVERRYQEQRQRERDARQQAERQAREAAINERHARQVTGESSYLAQQRARRERSE